MIPRTPPEAARRLRELDSRLRLRFDEPRKCWAVEEFVGAWGKWSPVTFWRDPQTFEALPLDGCVDALVSKLRDADWTRYGQRSGAITEINQDIDGGASVGKRDFDEERYQFNHHARDLYLRQMGMRKTMGPDIKTRLDSKDKAGYLHDMMRARERSGGGVILR